MFGQNKNKGGEDPNSFKAPRAPKPPKPPKVKVEQLPRAPGELSPLQARIAQAKETLSRGVEALKARASRKAPSDAAMESVRDLPAGKAASSVSRSPTTQKFAFVTDATDLQSIPTGTRVILWGGAVIASLEGVEGLAHLVEQPPRAVAAGFAMNGAAGRLRLWVPPTLLRNLVARRNRINFAVDYLLQFGLRQKRNCMVIGGMFNVTDGTMLDLMIFFEGRLVAIEQRSLQPKTSSYYQESVQSLIDGFITRENYEFKPNMVYLHDDVANGFRYRGPIATFSSEIFARPLNTRVRYGFRIGSPLDILLPIGIASATTAACAALVWNDWTTYQSSVRQFKQSIAGVEEDYAKGQASISLLELKKQYADMPVPQVEGVRRLRTLLEVVAAEHKGFVREIAFSVTPDPADPAEAAAAEAAALSGAAPPMGKPDFILKLSAPVDPDRSGIEQAETIVNAIARATGAEVRLASQITESDQKTPSVKYRVFELVGRYPAAETQGA